jgi:hypothetical protein
MNDQIEKVNMKNWTKKVIVLHNSIIKRHTKVEISWSKTKKWVSIQHPARESTESKSTKLQLRITKAN